MDDPQTTLVSDAPPGPPAPTPGQNGIATNGQQFALALAFMAVGAVLVLATYLRLTSLDLIQFTREEVAQLQISSQWLQHPTVTIPEATPPPTPDTWPLAVYLLSIPLSVSRDPVLAAGFVSFLNLLAVLGGYLLARRYFGQVVGLISALLYAVAPWAVIHARGLAPSGFLPLFALLFFHALFATFVERRSWHLVLAFVWLAVLMQIHPAAASFLPVLILALILYWRRLKPAALLVGLLAFLLTMSPTLQYGATHEWVNLRRLVAGWGAQGQLDLAAVRYSLQIATSAGFQTLAGQGYWHFQAGRPSLGWLDLVEQALIVVGILYLLVRVVVDRARAGGRPTPSRAVSCSLVLLWFLVPVLFNLRHPAGLEPAHLTLLYPSQFLILAILLEALATWVAKLLPRRDPSGQPGLSAHAAGYALPVLAVVALAAWQFQSTKDFHDLLDHSSTEGGYGTPIKYTLEVTDKARRLSQDLDNGRIVVLTESLDFAKSDLLTTLDYLFGLDVQPKYLDSGQRAFVFPASQGQESLYLVLPFDRLRAPPGNGLAESLLDRYGQELADQAVVLPGGESVVRFYRLQPASSALSQISPGMPVAMGDAVTLLAAEVDGQTEPGHTLPVTLTWTIRAVTPDSRHYAFFNHLVNDLGEKWAQDDGAGYNPYQWEVGETAVSWYRLQVPPETPPGRYWLLTGLYRVSDLKRLPLVGPDGQDLDKEMRLGPIKVARPRAVWEAEAAAMEQEARADLAGKVTFLGYDLPDRFPRPGDPLHLTLYWQAQAPMDRDYTIFAHLLDSEGRLRAQHDGQPQAGRYPTSIWAPGEIVRDVFEIIVPEDTPLGTYQLRVGMYDLTTMERLPVHRLPPSVGGTGVGQTGTDAKAREGPPNVVDDSILLAEIVVVP